MKLFCMSDTHGRVPPSVPMDTDIILHAGDFYNRLGGKTVGLSIVTTQKLCNNENGLIAWYKNLKCHIYFVRGNHDIFDPFNIVSKNDHTGCVTELCPGLFLIGLGWTGSIYYELPTLSNMKRRGLSYNRFRTKDINIKISRMPGSEKLEKLTTLPRSLFVLPQRFLFDHFDLL